MPLRTAIDPIPGDRPPADSESHVRDLVATATAVMDGATRIRTTDPASAAEVTAVIEALLDAETNDDPDPET